MPERLIPPGYRATLIGSATTLEGLQAYAPAEEMAPEGTLMLLRLDFADFYSSEALAELERTLREKGVTPWPGYSYIVYADATSPSIYVAWQKGFAWMTVIFWALVVFAVIPLIGALFWALMPQAIKDLVTMVLGMGMMLLMLWLMTRLIKPLTTPKRPRELEEPRR